MSVICGIYQMNEKPISAETCSRMMDKINKYPHDTDSFWYQDGLFFGYSSKYITPESKEELLPFYDKDYDLVITADAILDNREQLITQLLIKKPADHVITDSQLILAAYKKWGDSCVKYLIGDFTFVIWNNRKKEMFCARDQVGKRTFFYYCQEGTFAFCTVMKPLLVLSPHLRELDEVWITDFLSLPGVAHEFDCTRTVYQNIRQLLPAHTMTVTREGIRQSRYWYPLNIPKLHLKSEEEYEKAFLEIYSKAVRCRLRSNGSVGVMMSGGLDSGSVACLAAGQLAEKNDTLYAFSSIPFEGYQDWLYKSAIADETPYIEAIKSLYQNIDHTYCRCNNKNSLSDVDRLIDLLEQPYKIVENLFWYDEIAQTAAAKGCSVLLDGQFGNLSVSFGDFETQMVSLFRSGHLYTLLRELTAYCRHHQLRRIQVGKQISYAVLPYWIKKLLVNQRRTPHSALASIPVNPELYEKWRVQERFQKEGWDLYPYPSYNLSQMRKRILRPQHYSHLGIMETKVSLAYGIAKRDPTKDIRVIEFCLSIPGDQFVKNGWERNLIRRSMEGILPDPVRLNDTVRGQQSADWIQRLSPGWNELQEAFLSTLKKETLKPYLDIPKLTNILNQIGTSLNENHWNEVRMLVISQIFGRFIEAEATADDDILPVT